MKTIYFVRHGSTAHLEAASFQDFTTPLSEKGRAQARFVAERFKSISVEAIISSEMTRAMETASTISEAIGLPVEQSPLFHEILRPSAIRGKRRDDPESARIWDELWEHIDDPSKRHSDEEIFSEFKERAIAAVRLLESRPEETVLVITHGAFLKMLMAVMARGGNVSATDFMYVYEFLYPTETGITKCEFKEGKWWLMTWNDDAHLGEITAP